MSIRPAAARFGLPALLLALVTGCGGPDVPMQTTYKVTGRVTLDGKPAAGVDIRFIPKDKTNFKLEETPLGRTDADGRFTLATYITGDGAPAGDYMVAVSYPDQEPEVDGGDETTAAIAAAKAKRNRTGPRFPSLYQVPQKSGLSATVPKGGGYHCQSAYDLAAYSY